MPYVVLDGMSIPLAVSAEAVYSEEGLCEVDNLEGRHYMEEQKLKNCKQNMTEILGLLGPWRGAFWSLRNKAVATNSGAFDALKRCDWSGLA